LVVISTDYVFEGAQGNYKESDEKYPVNIYGKSKSLAENLIFSSGISYAIVRTSVIFGREEASGKKNFVLWLYENLRKGKSVNALVDNVVSPTYNVYLAKAILEIVERRLTGVWHIASRKGISRYEMACKVKEFFGLPGEVIAAKMEQMNWKAKRPANSSLDVSKALEYLKQKPATFEEWLREMGWLDA
ncbi:MAG: SDR family oxidoreductase, partial [Thermoplasmata archaeon]